MDTPSSERAAVGPSPGAAGTRRRLLAVAWQRPGTGLTRVADRLLGALGDEWTVDLVGIGYDGPVRSDGAVIRYPSEPGGRDVFGMHAATELLRRGPPPAAVLIHNDVWHLARYASVLGPHLAGAPLLAYVPLDGEPAPLSPAILRGLLPYRAVAVYTDWALAALADALVRVKAPGGNHGPTLARVPHGVDVEAFRPAAALDDARALRAARAALKRRLFPDLPDPEDTLLVLNANRPDPRKRVDASLEGFAEFLRRVPHANTRLVLHHALSTGEVGASLRASAERLGIGSKVVFDALGQPRVVSDGRLAELMAACEIGLNTSMGEGWGLLAFEHAATGAAQVLGRHSVHPELWEGAAVLVEPARLVVGRTSPLALAEPDPHAFGRALADLYADPDLRHQVALRCHRRAADPGFRWGTAEAAFRAFLEAGARRSAPPGADR